MTTMKILAAALSLALTVSAFSCQPLAVEQHPDIAYPHQPIPQSAKTLVVAGGCFWCLESQYNMLRGVYDVESGFAGGAQAGVSYEEVCTGRTGHAEAVKIFYNPKEISEADLLRIFFVIHNPTTLNRQGPDVGTQYRSAIFYSTPEEKALAEQIRNEIANAHIWSQPIVTTLEPLRNYTPAEEYHQHYFAKYEKATPQQRATMNAGYCAAVVEPHVLEFRQRFAARLKKQ